MERGLIKTSAGYIHYRATGQGKPVILMHPVPRSSAMFLELMEVLGKKLRIFAIDYPSYGMSDHIGGHPTIADYAKIVTEVMDGLGVGRSSFLGEAVGAFISVELANVYPERVEKIILVNCPFYPNEEYKTSRIVPFKALYRTDAMGFPLSRTLEEVLEKDSEHAPMNPTQSWMERDNVALIETGRDLWQAMDALVAYDLPSNLERLQHPVLLIWGENFFYRRFQDEVSRRIKNHQVVIIKGGRFHLAMDHTEEVGQVTLNFLA